MWLLGAMLVVAVEAAAKRLLRAMLVVVVEVAVKQLLRATLVVVIWLWLVVEAIVVVCDGGVVGVVVKVVVGPK